jgi:Gas vesicle synthesis protein GvpL/GvpF
MNRQGIYLYGFARPGTAAALPPELPGVEEGEPFTVVALGEGVEAVVSRVDAAAFEAATADTPDPQWIVPRALRHEQVVEAMLARSPVLPVRFGSVFSTDEALSARVSPHGPRIAQFLDHIADKQEWALRAYLDIEAAAERLIETDTELARRYRALPEAPGVRYFQEKKLREDARQAARKIARAEALAVAEAIQARAAGICARPLRATEAGREMVLHLACLLPVDAVEAALNGAAQASADAGGLLTLEPTGPWPPFNFCPGLEPGDAP